ncbi:MAG: phosphatase PAP2 family protein [Bacteroidetes bacterium]|nr:phosphatase PAP2 family protein [Bacteroidota bacterium]
MTIKKLFITLLLIIICGSSLFAQSPVLGNSLQRNRYNFSQFGNETWDFIKQPTKWNGSDWLKLGLVSAGTFLIIETADQLIRDAALRNQQYFNSAPIKIGNIWGDWYPTVIIGSAFALHGWLDNNSSSKKIAFEIVQAGLYTEILTQIIKHSFGRARPYKELGPTALKPFSFLGWDFTSLPAGHTTWAFSLSTVLSRNAKPGWLKVLAYIPAALTFIARVYQDHHWTSDNFLGAALGYFVATWVVDQHDKKDLLVEVSSGFPLTITIPLN